MKINFWNIPNYIKELEFDGDKTDLRLHSDNWYNWGADNEEDYEEATELIDSIEEKGNGYTIYCWCDISGYDYWMINMQETNYIQISVMFDSPTIDESELENLKTLLDKVNSKCVSIATRFNYNPEDEG